MLGLYLSFQSWNEVIKEKKLLHPLSKYFFSIITIKSMSLQKRKHSGDWRREERGLLPCKHVKTELQLVGFAAKRQDLGDGYYMFI